MNLMVQSYYQKIIRMRKVNQSKKYIVHISIRYSVNPYFKYHKGIFGITHLLYLTVYLFCHEKITPENSKSNRLDEENITQKHDK